MAESEFNWLVAAPFISLSTTGFLVLLVGLIFPKLKRGGLWPLMLAGFGVAFVFATAGWGESQQAFNNMLVGDMFSTAFCCIFILGGALTLLFSLNEIENQYIIYPDYFSLIAFATAGMTLMASSSHLLIIFLGLETLSIALYVLVGCKRGNQFSLEASFKYFLLGAFASGFLLYGIALIYGATGSMHLEIIGELTAQNDLADSTMLISGILLLFVGLGFKIAIFPFHMWAPDVYEGAPTPISAFMATGSKAAGFAALLRLFSSIDILSIEMARDMIWVMAVASIILGNIIALKQTNVKRMLAYSSIAHAGYLLIGVLANNQVGLSSLTFYLLVYAFMNIGAFGVISYISTSEREMLSFDDFKALAYTRPFAAAAMAIFLFSLAGVPPTAGFMAKFYIFSAGVKAGYIWLSILAVTGSMISLYYYLGLVVKMFMVEEEPLPGKVGSQQGLVGLALGVACGAVIALGLFPSRWIDVFHEMARSLM